MPEPGDPPLSYVLTRLARQLSRALSDAHLPGLSGPQVVALLTLKHEPGLSNAQLARRCFVTAQSMSEVVLDLEQRELLSRAPDPSNQRILRAQLTPSGHASIESFERRIVGLESQMLAGFSPRDAARFREAAVKAAHNLGLPPPQGAAAGADRRTAVSADG